MGLLDVALDLQAVLMSRAAVRVEAERRALESVLLRHRELCGEIERLAQAG